MRRAELCAALVLASCLVAHPAAACSWIGAPEPVGFPSATFLSKGLYGAATFVDLAVVETARPLPGRGSAIAAQAITFRVLQRWKGNSPDRFVLFGDGLDPKGATGAGWFRHHWVDARGRVTPHATPWESPTGPEFSMSTCDPGFLRPAPGNTYVIFREADGRLLGPVIHHPGEGPQRGLEFVEVTSPREDDWLSATFLGSFDVAKAAERGPADAAPKGDRALVRFARPLDANVAMAVLRSAGVKPYAVQTVAADFWDELRVPADRAALSLVTEALNAARANMAAPPAQKAARELLKGLQPERLENDTWLRVFALALVLAEERRARASAAGAPLVGGVEVLGNVAAWNALRRDSRVAKVIGGEVHRGRSAVRDTSGRTAAATPAALDIEARTVSPAFLLHQLRVLAGEVRGDAPAPERLARQEAPAPDTRACRRVDASTARAFAGLALRSDVAGVRVYGEPVMVCRAGADGSGGECSVMGPTRMRLEFASGATSGFEVPRAEPVLLRFDRSTFGCSAARER